MLWLRTHGWLIGALAFFAFCCLLWMPSLGLEYDEAHFLAPAVDMLVGKDEYLQWPDGFSFQGHQFPFMTMPYLGSLDAWPHAVLWKLFGISVMSSRLLNTVLGLLVIGAGWRLAHAAAGLTAANFCAWLLALDLEFILHAPTNFGPLLYQQLGAAIGLLLLWRYFDEGPRRYYFAAIAVFALVMHEKLTFLFVLAPLFLALLLVRWQDLRRRLSVFLLFGGLLLALLLLSPMLVYAFAHPDIVFGFGKSSVGLAQPYAAVLSERWAQWWRLLNGVELVRLMAGFPSDLPARWPLPGLVWLASLVLLLRPRSQPLGFVCAFVPIGLVMVNTFFPDGGRLHHLILAYPLAQAAMGIMLARIPRVGMVIVAIAALQTLLCTASFTHHVMATGGRNHWDTVTRSLARFAESEPPSNILVSGTWGMARNVRVLTQGRRSMVEAYFEASSGRFDASLIERDNARWCFGTFEDPYVAIRDAWLREAQRLGRTPHRITTLRERGPEEIEVWATAAPKPRHWQASDVGRPERSEAICWQGGELRAGSQALRLQLRGPFDASQTTQLHIALRDAAGQDLTAWTRDLRTWPLFQQQYDLIFAAGAAPLHFYETRAANTAAPARFLVWTEGRGCPPIMQTNESQ
jgi:hypothetical protein